LTAFFILQNDPIFSTTIILYYKRNNKSSYRIKIPLNIDGVIRSNRRICPYLSGDARSVDQANGFKPCVFIQIGDGTGWRPGSINEHSIRAQGESLSIQIIDIPLAQKVEVYIREINEPTGIDAETLDKLSAIADAVLSVRTIPTAIAFTSGLSV